MVLPTAVGVPRPSALVPETMAAGDLASDDPVVAVGFRGLKDFHPALLADMLSRAGVRARGVELELIPEGRADVNALGLRAGVRRPGLPRARRGPAGRAQAGRRRAHRVPRGAGDQGSARRVDGARGRARPARVRGAHRCRRPCPACACSPCCARRCGGPASTLRLNNVVVGAERDGRPAAGGPRPRGPARGAPRGGLVRARLGRRRERRRGARLALAGPRGRARARRGAGCRRRASRASRPATSTSSR